MVPTGSHFTDDTVMTLAVAEWLMTDPKHEERTLIECMQRLGRKYPHAGYGTNFMKWLNTDNPQPYNSYGNGSAMRVSPVGLYAQSLEEAMELARITASVSHNHPEGIRGAQAVAVAVFLAARDKYAVKDYIQDTVGYNLDGKLEDIREDYVFDNSCQGSVPIAIMAYLQRKTAYLSLKLAVSMGGDTDTIASITTAIAMARNYDVSFSSQSNMPEDVVKQCRSLLPHDLLDINDRFEDFLSKPLRQSYKLDKGIYVGEYPGDKNEDTAANKIAQMTHFGIRHFVDLTQEGELIPYSSLLPDDTDYHRFPISDCGTPKSVEDAHRLLRRIEELRQMDGDVYLHSRSGAARTGTIAACYIAMKQENPTLDSVLKSLRQHLSAMPKAAHRDALDSTAQREFVARFINGLAEYREDEQLRVPDCIRGCMMAGAAGDALGYPVEFMNRNEILAKYGAQGITQFEIDRSSGKALVSDDTQMTLFTACSILAGVTHRLAYGIGGAPEDYVDYGYADWYYTQTGKSTDDHKPMWLRDLPEMAHRRAPDTTCLNACEVMFNEEKVSNDSKGCGGIISVAPMGLLEAAHLSRECCSYNLKDLAEAGAKIASVTHKHPLAFLPASLLTVFLYEVVPLSVEQVKAEMDEILDKTVATLDSIYTGDFEEEKRSLKELTAKAVQLARTDIPDSEAIHRLGEGWAADEAWAIALFCTIRHIDSVKDAIVTAVNHDGDSDSIGSIIGNMMGAIHGYEEIRKQRLFCPEGRDLEQTLELSNLILTLADDLVSGCIISDCNHIVTPKMQQWAERYCD